MERGKLELSVASTLNIDTMLIKGTQVGLFQVCEHPIKIVNGIQEESEDTMTVCSVQEDLDLESKFRNHLKSISRPDLEQHFISLLKRCSRKM